jgi:serine/threonine protein kinase/Flp pilus assembly protein TadD
VGVEGLSRVALAPGTRLGTYEIVAPLGAGGMGEVYRALDTRLGREIAVKVLPADVAGDPDRLARFEREARTAAGLNHPNIVLILSVEEERDIRFLTMELIEGQDLRQLVKPGGMPLARVLDLAIPLADALATAHERRVVHRDLKPANVMVTREGRVKVLDFGLAKTLPSTSPSELTQLSTLPPSMSVVGEVMGTLAYMAPEQIRGGALDARTDLFAFGILLHELLTGRRPFEGATAADLSSAILRDPPTPLQSLRDDLPPDVCRIVGRCLEKDPERRLQTAKDLRNELDRVRSALVSAASAVTRPGAPTATPTQDLPSIAVLPFVNRSRDADDEYFADGITEDVIAQLCKVRTLRVVSRTSVMAFKQHEESLKDIASALRVGNILEGSVRRSGDRVRIVAQLIDAGTGQHLWAETYDRDLKDIFGIQSEVALQIAASLKAELSLSDRDRIRRQPTRDVLAYELYLRGRQCFVRFTPEEMRRSIDFFDRAIERDPRFALAYVGLASAYTELVVHGELSRDEAGARAVALAEMAKELDPELGDAHSALSHARVAFEFDWEGAEAGYKRAIELSPNSADSFNLYGRMCAGLERFDEAIALQQRAFELDPLTHRGDLATAFIRAGRYEEAARVASNALVSAPHDARLHATLGWALFRRGRVDDGLVELEHAVRLLPADTIWLSQLGEAYGLSGRIAQAREVLRRLEDPSRATPVSPYHLAYVYAGLGDAERALDQLERAFEARVGPVYAIKGSFLLEPLRHHPRFMALLAKMRLR